MSRTARDLVLDTRSAPKIKSRRLSGGEPRRQRSPLRATVDVQLAPPLQNARAHAENSHAGKRRQAVANRKSPAIVNHPKAHLVVAIRQHDGDATGVCVTMDVDECLLKDAEQ